MARAREERGDELDARKLPAGLSQRLASLLADRAGPSSSHLLWKKYIERKPAEDTVVLEFVQREALDLKNFGTDSWAPKLELVRRCYELGVVFEPYGFHRQRNVEGRSPMALGIAQEIVSTPDQFPSFLLAMAEERCRQDVS
jgi:hypothetical protein